MRLQAGTRHGLVDIAANLLHEKIPGEFCSPGIFLPKFQMLHKN
nr:MAG TPA: hypothetical protein [Caudoviricetes sp.]